MYKWVKLPFEGKPKDIFLLRKSKRCRRKQNKCFDPSNFRVQSGHTKGQAGEGMARSLVPWLLKDRFPPSALEILKQRSLWKNSSRTMMAGNSLFPSPSYQAKAGNGCLTDDKDEPPASAYLLCFYDD